LLLSVVATNWQLIRKLTARKLRQKVSKRTKCTPWLRKKQDS